MDKAHEVTLITVTYNSAATLRSCWQTVSSSVRWIVVDNASIDDSAQVARDLGAEVISLSENVGFSRANNIGLSRCDSKYVGFVNPDITINEDHVANMARHLEQHPGLAAPQLTYPDGSTQPAGRGYPTIWAKFANRLFGNRSNYLLFAPPGKAVSASWAMGAAVFGATSTVRSLGGWNERFFLYYEDAEISLRAWRSGVPTTICGCTPVVHQWARETKKLQWKPWQREIRAARTFYRLRPYLLLPSALHRIYPSYMRSWLQVETADCAHANLDCTESA
ncbi:glycosyltransferase family 2 protein [Nocardioides endophyticus]|uniref:Glycosyltransferase family 2 protein n=1 Tax=Nocardioides endophyticus TaxID=1353775 RepID=A0ABP8YX37_9ACTN